MPAIDHKLLKFQQLKASLSMIDFTTLGLLLRSPNRGGKPLFSRQFSDRTIKILHRAENAEIAKKFSSLDFSAHSASSAVNDF